MTALLNVSFDYVMEIACTQTITTYHLLSLFPYTEPLNYYQDI